MRCAILFGTLAAVCVASEDTLLSQHLQMTNALVIAHSVRTRNTDTGGVDTDSTQQACQSAFVEFTLNNNECGAVLFKAYNLMGADNIAVLEQVGACSDVLTQGAECDVIKNNLPQVKAAGQEVVTIFNGVICPSGCWPKFLHVLTQCMTESTTNVTGAADAAQALQGLEYLCTKNAHGQFCSEAMVDYAMLQETQQVAVQNDFCYNITYWKDYRTIHGADACPPDCVTQAQDMIDSLGCCAGSTFDLLSTSPNALDTFDAAIASCGVRTPPPCASGSSVSSALIVGAVAGALFGVLALYCILGISYRRFIAGQSGFAQLPHSNFWARVLCCCTGTSSSGKQSKTFVRLEELTADEDDMF